MSLLTRSSLLRELLRRKPTFRRDDVSLLPDSLAKLRRDRHDDGGGRGADGDEAQFAARHSDRRSIGGSGTTLTRSPHGGRESEQSGERSSRQQVSPSAAGGRAESTPQVADHLGEPAAAGSPKTKTSPKSGAQSVHASNLPITKDKMDEGTDTDIYHSLTERLKLEERWKTSAKVVQKGTRVLHSKDVPIPNTKIQDFIWTHADPIIHESLGICGLTKRDYTYYMIQQASLCLAAALRVKLSLQRGLKVAILLPNVPEYLIVYYGILTAGLVVVPVSPLKNSKELFSDLSVIRPSVIICASPKHNNIETVAKQLSDTGNTVLLIPMSNKDPDEETIPNSSKAGRKPGEGYQKESLVELDNYIHKRYEVSVKTLLLEGSTLDLPDDCKPSREAREDDICEEVAVLPYVRHRGDEGKKAADRKGAAVTAVDPDKPSPPHVSSTKTCKCIQGGEPRVSRLTHRNVVGALVSLYDWNQHIRPLPAPKSASDSAADDGSEDAASQESMSDSNIEMPMVSLPLQQDRLTLLSLVPLSHYFGSLVSQASVALYGARLITMPLFAPDFFISTMVTFRPTVLVLVPALLEVLVFNKSIRPTHLSSVRVIAVSVDRLSKELFFRFRNKFKRKDIIFKQYYYMMEAGVVCSTVNRFVESFDPNCLGGPVANMEYRVFSSRRGKPIPWATNEFPGRIEVKGANLMRHYWNCQQTKNCRYFNEGYYKTGDIGFFTSPGELFLMERFKDRFVLDGVTVNPQEMEAILKTHQKIQDAAILEVLLPVIGFAPRAFIVLKSGKSQDYVTLSQVNSYLGNILSVKNPLRAGIQIVEKIPRRSDNRTDMAELKRIYYNVTDDDGEEPDSSAD